MAGEQKTMFKLVRHDPYTARISLRSDWVKDLDLKAGDMISQEVMDDGSLVLRPVRKPVVAQT